MFKSLLIVLFSLNFIAACGLAGSQAADISDAVIIDVRTQAEWQEGHLEQASLIPWEGILSGVENLNLDKKQKIAVFCRSGTRAAKAIAVLNDAGYSQVVNLGSMQQAAEKLNKPIVQKSQ